MLRKGSKIACSGELSTREHGGKTYLQVRTNGITVQGTPAGGTDAPQEPQRSSRQAPVDDLDDVPFATNNAIW